MAQQISLKLRTAAFLMRQMPTDSGKIAWWWERLYGAIGGGHFVFTDDERIDAQWPAGLHGPIRLRRGGFKIFLDLQTWAERRIYFSGSYYQIELEYLFAALLREKDQYLDIGANIGVTSLLASALLGPRARGFAFEPNPDVFKRLNRNFEINRISNLVPVPYALSDRETEARLVTSNRNTGTGFVPDAGETTLRGVTIQTTTGAAYISQLDPKKPTFVKIDVEGHEVKALAGMDAMLEWPEIALISEVNGEMLQRAGDSTVSLFGLMQKHGFEAFTFDVERGRLKSKLIVRPMAFDGSESLTCDVLFAKVDSRFFRERIAPYLNIRAS